MAPDSLRSLRAVDLDRFFRPAAVAVIGASDTPGRPNTLVFSMLLEWADRSGAAMYPVNPKRDRIGERDCYPSIAEVPADVDVAVILVGDAVGALEEVVDAGVAFAVVFAAGFAEVGDEGEALQHRVEELIAASRTRLLGPNTNLNAFELFRDDLDGPAITLITQSGHQGRPVFQGQDLGVRLSHWAPTGNEADLEFADFARYFADLPDTGAIACYIEGFKDGRTMRLAADHAIRRGVPIVCVKVGRTEAGRAMSKSHTGHLTGTDDVISAVFRQHGVVRVDGLDELLDTTALFARAGEPTADGVCVYSISGGTGAHMADLCAAAGLELPTLSDHTQRHLHEWIPEYLTVSNPVDNGGHPAGDERGRKILDTILADPAVGVLICPITGAVPPIDERLATDLVEVAETSDKPVCVIWGSPVGDESPYRDILLKSSRVAVFRSFANCVAAVRDYLTWHEFRRGYESPFDAPVPTPGDVGAARALLGTSAGALSEPEAKAVLRSYGVPVTRDEAVGDADEAVKAADAIGYPVVVKAHGRELLHKSDLGLIAVGLDSADEVGAAAERMLESGRPVDGLLVSEQVEGGVETVVGVSHDDLFGPVVMFGLGGVFVEVLEDVTFRVPPFTENDAHRMLREVKGFPLLTGVRGSQPADLDALVDVIMRVQALALDFGDGLVELDINPLVALPEGAVALDALIIGR